MSAVIILQEALLRKSLDPNDHDEDEDENEVSPEGNKDKTAVLAIAYHNMGVEQEFLRSYPAAILSYKKAVNFAEKNIGPEDPITQNLKNVYENARNELETALMKKTGGVKKKGGKVMATSGSKAYGNKKMQQKQEYE